MVLTEQMITVLFKFLNFVLLLGLMLYGVKVYLLPGLKEQLTKYRAYLEGLRRSHRALQKDANVLKKGMSEDEEQQERLKKQVKQWRTVVQEQRDDLVREREERKEALLKRFKENKEQISLYRTYKQVVPEAIEQSRKELTKQFAHNAQQERFIKKIMIDLRK